MNKTPTVKFPRILRDELSNGLQVVLMPHDKLPLVTVKLLIRSGGSSVPPEKAGLAMLTTELLKKGAGSLDSEAFSETVDFLGGYVDTAALQDYSVITAGFMQQHLDKALHLVRDMVMSPHFPDDEFEKSRQRLAAAVRGIKDNPSAIAGLYFQKWFYGEGHPYAVPNAGTPASILSLQPEDVRQFHRDHFSPRNAILVITGRFDVSEVTPGLEDIFGGWQGNDGRNRERIFLEPSKENRIIIMNKPELVQTQVKMGAPGIYRGHPDAFPLVVANTILGGGFTSRLVEEVRVRRGLTYSISSGFSRGYHQGAFAIGSFTKNESVGEIIQVILQVIAGFRDSSIQKEEIRDAIRYLTGLYPLSLETQEQLAGQLSAIAHYGLPHTWLSDYIPSLKAVTDEDVHRVVSRHMTDRGFTIVLLGNGEVILPQVEHLGRVTIHNVAEHSF